MHPTAALRAAHHDEHIHEAALDEIRALGVDAIELATVADRAGLPLASVESAYPTVAELLVDLWERRCATAVIDLLDLALGALASPNDPGRRRALAVAVDSPTPALFAGIEMCAVAHRIDELSDVVPRDVRRWFDRHGLLELPLRADQVRAVVLTAGVLLAVVRNQGLPTPIFDAVWSIDLLDRMEPPALLGMLDESDLPRRGAPASLAALDATSAALVTAATTVVGRSGVRAATSARLRRAAALPSEVEERTIIERAAVIDHLAGHVSRTLTDLTTIAARVDDGSFVVHLAAWIGRHERLRARMGRELILSLCHDGPETLRASQDALFDSLADRFADRFGGRDETRQLAGFVYTSIDGLVLLDELVGEISDLDWRPFGDAALAAASTGRVVGA